MVALSAKRINIPTVDYASTKTSLFVSFALHLSFFVISGIGFAISKDKIQVIDTPPIQVEFISTEEAEIQKAKTVKKNRAAEKATKVAEQTKPTPPTPPKPPEPVKPVENVAAPKIKPKPKIDTKPIVKPQEIIEKAKEQQQEQTKSQFTSVLKNLVGEEELIEETDEENEAQVPNPVLTRQEQSLSLSEQDALRYQLSQCWKVVPGVNTQDLSVAVTLRMNPNATLASAQIKDTARYNRDPYFRAAADSALRAVRSPMCNPLKLPLNKFEQWKTITINFDPRQMFGG